jgi:hypothetical protein
VCAPRSAHQQRHQALKKDQLPEDLATQIEVYDEESQSDQEELDQRFSDMGVDDIECVLSSTIRPHYRERRVLKLTHLVALLL